jgi:hypothetical protein
VTTLVLAVLFDNCKAKTSQAVGALCPVEPTEASIEMFHVVLLYMHAERN